jgi:hypothetical protein
MYAQMIQQALLGTKHAFADPADVEAWMRLERGTLDSLSPEQFKKEAREAAMVASISKTETAELRRSYGL